MKQSFGRLYFCRTYGESKAAGEWYYVFMTFSKTFAAFLMAGGIIAIVAATMQAISPSQKSSERVSSEIQLTAQVEPVIAEPDAEVITQTPEDSVSTESVKVEARAPRATPTKIQLQY